MTSISAGGAAGRQARLCAGLVVAIALASHDARALDLLQDDYTSVAVEGKLPYKVTSLGSPHITVGGEITEHAATSFAFDAHEPEGWTPSALHATGTADFGMLGATLELFGGSALQASVAPTFHDVFTVAAPSGIAAGTPGTMSIVYLVEGLVEANGLPIEPPANAFSVATVALQMIKYVSDGGAPPTPVAEPLEGDSFEVISSDSLGGDVPNTESVDVHRHVSIDVPFEYGVPLALRTTLGIAAFTDNTFDRSLSNPYRELWGGGVVQSVDASNSAELIAIVNEAHPEAAVIGVSVDYSPLVTDTTPVPEPSVHALGAVATALVLVLARRRRSPAQGTGRLQRASVG